ncbi:MAG: 1,4-dihydroxy-2-naphthoate octaprenyltransferase [Thermoprotei archaeon]
MPSSFNNLWKFIINVVYITRPWSFLMTIASVTSGIAYAYYELNIFNPIIYLITLIGAISLHAYTNVINDYFDTLYGVDKPDAPTTRYRPHPIISGIFKPHHTLKISIGYFFVAVLAGFSLYLLRRPLILFLGLIGALISLEYTGPPLKYKYKGLGELAVFIVWGPLIFLGSYYAQTGIISFKPILISFPIGLLVAAVLLIDGIRDYEYDKSSNIKTLPILIGKQNALKLYYILITSPLILVILFIIINILGIPSLIIFLTLPKLISLIKRFSKQIPNTAAPQTSKFTLLFGIFYIIGMILSKII